MSRVFVIGSRGSKLALWQANWVRERIEAASPGARVRVEVIKTEGDARRDVPLSVIGGRGVFTKEIEQALIESRVDIAVHSLKDLPTVTPHGLHLAATPEREDARDALVLREGFTPDERTTDGALTLLPRGARVGTSSVRRLAQLKHRRPDLNILDLRGNVDTRLRKLDGGWYEAVVLASAGLRRLGLDARISAPLTTEEMLPAVGQGALGLETRRDDEETNALLRALDHAPTRAACTAERSLLRALGGGCQLPIAAHAVVVGDTLKLEALVAAPEGEKIIGDAIEGDTAEAEELGARLSEILIGRGALTLLPSAAQNNRESR
ncbi:MAG TPA: hydroxymethylbilane synthase [Pyrinomonadaceae bacterium]|nr:hydroxymethylbilane synthase [Pyrinomonadaceae bacterium]